MHYDKVCHNGSSTLNLAVLYLTWQSSVLAFGTNDAKVEFLQLISFIFRVEKTKYPNYLT